MQNVTPLVYVAILFAFGLPMVSASCTSGDLSGNSTHVDSEPLTGWQLVLGEEPQLRFTPPPTGATATSAEENVRTVLDSASRAARITFGVTILTLVLSLAGAYKDLSPRSSLMLLVAGIVEVLSFVPLFMVGVSTGFGPDVHHHYGYWATASLALAGLSIVTIAGMGTLLPKERIVRATLVLFFLLVGAPFAAALGFLI